MERHERWMIERWILWTRERWEEEQALIRASFGGEEYLQEIEENRENLDEQS
jgi:hypothetical protein